MLSLAPQAELRRRAAEICFARPRRTEGQLRADVFRLTAMLLRAAASDYAAALGTNEEELLRFANPLGRELALEGNLGVYRRLDRALGGGALAILEARQPLRFKWTGPGLARFYVLRGEASSNGRHAAAHEILLAPVGAAVHIAAGGHLLLRSPAIGNMLEIAHKAGLDLDQLIAEAMHLEVLVESALGRLTLSDDDVVLGPRHIRLSEAETAVLRALAVAGGAIVARAELAAVAKLKSEKSLEHVLVQLRDKMGDGLITTVYGSGCALEMKPGL